MAKKTPSDPFNDSAKTLSELLQMSSDVDDRATARLGELVKQVRATGKKGTLTLTLKVEERNADTHELGVQWSVRVTAPNNEMIHSFYSDEEGNISKTPESHLFTGKDAEAEHNQGDSLDPGF